MRRICLLAAVLSLLAGLPEGRAAPPPGEGPFEELFEDARELPGAAARTFIENQPNLNAELRSAMAAAIRRDLKADRWSGANRSELFGMAAQRLPQGAAGRLATPGMLRLTQAMALGEILKNQAVRDHYEAQGFTDLPTLRSALELAAGQRELAGSIDGVRLQAAVCQGWAMAWVAADASSVITHLRQPAALAEVRKAYRQLLHLRIQRLREQGQWEAAVAWGEHLEQLELADAAVYVEVAQCLQELGRRKAVVELIARALAAGHGSGTVAAWEQLGDLVLDEDRPEAQEAAAAAYRAASELLQNLRTTGEQP